MATTSPDNIWTPDAGDDYALTTDLATMADTIQEAIADRARTGVANVANAATRDVLYPSPVQGDTVRRLDTGWVETYYSTWNATTNPGGASSAGWYPVSGRMPYAVATGTVSTPIATGSWSTGNIGFSAGGFEHGGFTSSGNPNYYIGVPYPGLYDIDVYNQWASSGAGNLRGVRIALNNGGTIPANYDTSRHAVAGSTYGSKSAFLNVAIPNNLQFQIFQDSGGSLNSLNRIVTINYKGPVGVIQNVT